METAILEGVGKKLKNDWLNGKVSDETVINRYKKNKKRTHSHCMVIPSGKYA